MYYIYIYILIKPYIKFVYIYITNSILFFIICLRCVAPKRYKEI